MAPCGESTMHVSMSEFRSGASISHCPCGPSPPGEERRARAPATTDQQPQETGPATTLWTPLFSHRRPAASSTPRPPPPWTGRMHRSHGDLLLVVVASTSTSSLSLPHHPTRRPLLLQAYPLLLSPLSSPLSLSR